MPDRFPLQRELRRWLRAPGSLTAHLRATGAPLAVRRLAQGPRPPQGDEAASLGCHGRLRLHAREVLLELSGQPMVYARSVTSSAAIGGPWRALRGLGSRPLAELLYASGRAGPGIRRSALAVQRIGPCGPWRRHLQRRLAAEGAGALLGQRVLWARHSVFTKRGCPLRVMEVFSPALGPLRR